MHIKNTSFYVDQLSTSRNYEIKKKNIANLLKGQNQSASWKSFMQMLHIYFLLLSSFMITDPLNSKYMALI